MERSAKLVFVVLASLQLIHAVDNRAAVAQKLVSPLGVTFYTPAQLQTIMSCIDPQFYKTPNNVSAIISVTKTCVVNNSGSKAVQALSLYSGANNCLNPDDLVSLATKWAPTLKKLVNPLLTKCVYSLKTSKANNLTQEASLQKLYGIVKAAVTVSYVDNICIKFVKANVTATQWKCALQYGPQVMNITRYNCSRLVIA